MVDLTEFLMPYMDRPMVRGLDDCSLLLADWWVRNHGTDPATSLRGTYSTEDEQNIIIKSAGGLVNLVASLAANVSAQQSAANVTGDFGVIAIRGGGVIAAIRSRSFWAARSENGIAFTSDAKLLRGWSI